MPRKNEKTSHQLCEENSKPWTERRTYYLGFNQFLQLNKNITERETTNKIMDKTLTSDS